MSSLDRQPIESELIDLDRLEPIDDDTPEDEPPGDGEDEEGDATPRMANW